MKERLSQTDAEIVLYHNHPSDCALSGSDLALLVAYPGLRVIVAVGHGGNFTSARLAPGAAESLKVEADSGQRGTQPEDVLFDEHARISDEIFALLQPLVKDGTMLAADANRWHIEMQNRILAKLGFVEYETNFELPIEQMAQVEGLTQALKALDEKHDATRVRNRPAGTIRATGGVVGVLDQLARSQSKRPDGQKRKATRGRASGQGVRESDTGLTPPRPPRPSHPIPRRVRPELQAPPPHHPQPCPPIRPRASCVSSRVHELDAAARARLPHRHRTLWRVWRLVARHRVHRNARGHQQNPRPSRRAQHRRHRPPPPRTPLRASAAELPASPSPTLS